MDNDILLSDLIESVSSDFPVGIYEAKLLSADKDTAATGTTMLYLSWEICNGDQAGKQFRSGISLDKGTSQAPLYYLLKALNADNSAKTLSELSGKTCQVKVLSGNSRFAVCEFLSR